MDRITFSVNGRACSVGSEVDSDVSLNTYLRDVLNFRGTKYMCKEGGCGACIVAARVPDVRTKKLVTKSVNSCLVSITSCQDWEIMTIEGIGDRRIGYHPVQRTLAEYNGTQCGYCSPAWCMSMYSLLESNDYKLTQYQIENSFGSNTCRCTGFRPILAAFKSFAKDAPKPNKYIEDIEDLKVCDKSKCEQPCGSDWCLVNKSDLNEVKKIHLKDNRTWYRVTELKHIFEILDMEQTDSYMLVGGNTGRGAVPIFSFPRVLIDTSPIEELKVQYIDQNLVVGAGTTLTDLMILFKTVANMHEEFSYLMKFYDHLDLVAHIPVRNIGTIAGNLMLKHRLPTFSSDVFLLLECIGATLTIVSRKETIEILPEQFLSVDMKNRVITKIKIPPLSPYYYSFVSFKIMPRSQNAHAQVNAAFLYEFDPKHKQDVVNSARIVITGLSAHFVHATKTERFLHKKKLFTNEVLQGALKCLDEEIVAEELPGELKAEYRKKCALGLFYKGLLVLIPNENLKPIYRSGARDFRKTRPLSNGTEVYDTNPIIWPLNMPMPKAEALIQTAGELKYTNDIPTLPDEVFCAFVTSDICVGEIESLDPTPALKIPGVLAFFSVKDIPGINSFLTPKIPSLVPEPIFVEKKIEYYDQAIGVIVAESDELANQAALLVRIKYKVNKRKPLLNVDDTRRNDPSRVTLYQNAPARDRGLDVQKIYKSSTKLFGQYHFTMETLSAVTRPSDDGIEVTTSTQTADNTQICIADALNIRHCRVTVISPQCGGAYGIKISRSSQVACASALVTYLLNRPCRFILHIQANLKVIGKRNGSTNDYEIGVNNEGEIQFLNYELYEETGYLNGEGLGITVLGIPGIRNCYDNRRWQMQVYIVRTDIPAVTYCRAPGALETIAMAEYIMERISYEVDKDPVDVRRINFNREYTDVEEIMQTLLDDSEYYKRKEEVQKFNKNNRWKKRGIRISLMSFPAAHLQSVQFVLSVCHGDASIVVECGGIEIGQGLNTKIIQTIAFTLNIPMEKIKIKLRTSDVLQNSFITGGSRTTQASCFAAVKCCQILLDRLSTIRETLNNPTWELLITTAYTQGINLTASYFVNQNDLRSHRSAGAAIAEIELDILTGEHEVLRVDLIEDVGTSVNPELDIGQIEGAFIMGMGYWTHEYLIFDKKTGELLTDRTWTYNVPLAKDIPIDFRVKLRRNSYEPNVILGAKAVAEPPTCLAICVAFAIRAAITASREDSGYPRTEWYDVDGPYNLEANVLSAKVHLEEFLLY